MRDLLQQEVSQRIAEQVTSQRGHWQESRRTSDLNGPYIFMQKDKALQLPTTFNPDFWTTSPSWRLIVKYKHKHPTIMAGAGLAALLFLPSLGFAQSGLGSAASFAVLAGSTITNTGATTINGDVGVSPGTAIDGLPVGQPTGTVHAGDAVAAQAQADLTTHYDFLAGMACNVPMTGVDLGGQTLTPGVYCFTSSAGLTGILNLDAQGDTAAVFVFQIMSTLTVADGSSVILSNGAQGRHVWWQVGSSATLGISSMMLGNVLAHTSITLNGGASVAGRALAQGGAVTMDTNSIVAPGDMGTPTFRPTWGMIKSMYR